VSFVFRFLERDASLTSFGDPAVVSDPFYIFLAGAFGNSADVWSTSFLSLSLAIPFVSTKPILTGKTESLSKNTR